MGLGSASETTYDIPECYVIELFRNKSKAIVATFSRQTKEPFSSISDYVVDEFIAGELMESKAEGVGLFLLMQALTKDDESVAVARGFLTVLQTIAMSNVASQGILDPDRNNFKDLL